MVIYWQLAIGNSNIKAFQHCQDKKLLPPKDVHLKLFLIWTHLRYRHLYCPVVPSQYILIENNLTITNTLLSLVQQQLTACTKHDSVKLNIISPGNNL